MTSLNLAVEDLSEFWIKVCGTPRWYDSRPVCASLPLFLCRPAEEPLMDLSGLIITGPDGEKYRLVRADAPAKYTMAERTINAKCEESWNTFQIELARLEAVYEFLKLKFRILENEYQSQYLETKLNDGLAKK